MACSYFVWTGLLPASCFSITAYVYFSLQKRRESSETKNQTVTQLQEEKTHLEAQVQDLIAALTKVKQEKAQLEAPSRSSATEITKLKGEKADLEFQIKQLTADATKLKEEKASVQKQQAEAASRVESLELQVKDLMADSSRLRQEVADLQAASRKQEAEREDMDEASQLAELRKTNAYLQTKVEELEKHLEKANTRPGCGTGSVVSLL